MKRKTIIKIILIVSVVIASIFIFSFSFKSFSISTLKRTPQLGGSYKIAVIREYSKPYDFALWDNDGSFCVQQGASLRSGTVMQANKYVRINGRDSTISVNGGGSYAANGRNENLVMTWILCQEDSGSSYANGNTYYSPMQKAIYQYYGTWKNAIGLSSDYNSGGESYQDWINQASNWANGYSPDNAYINNNNANLSKSFYGDYIKIGPINWTFNGSITDAKVYNQNGSVINAKFAKYVGSTFTEYTDARSAISSGNDFYVLISASENASSVKITGQVSKNKDTSEAEVWVLENNGTINGRDIQTIIVGRGTKGSTTSTASTEVSTSLVGSFSMSKIDETTKKGLANVGFTLRAVSGAYAGQYVVQNSNGSASYSWTKSEIKTDQQGNLTITNLMPGKYELIETTNPNPGYGDLPRVIDSELLINPGGQTTKTVTNRREYVFLSGYVWEDKPWQDGKEEKSNDRYYEGSQDNQDVKVSGIVVRLKDNNNSVIQQTTTDSNGNYRFNNVLIDKIPNYYIEFTYNGMKYQSVPITDLSYENATKAIEKENRTNFNNKYAEIVNGHANDQNGNKTYDLTYKRENYTSTIQYTPSSQYEINSDTYKAYQGYLNKIKTPDEIRTQEIIEIGNINLGIELREQPDLAIMKDLQNVRLSINGYQHVYEYSQRFVNQGEYGDGFNIGVKFGNKYGSMSYTRPIYKADYEYTSEDKSNELQVYLTYRISIKNLSTNLKVKAGSILDYYDSNYELIAVGTGVNEKGEITGNLNKTAEENYNQNYKKIIINTNYTLDPQSKGDVYIQFKLNREAVIKIISDQETLENVTEINSYATYDANGEIYAGIDKNSAPANAIPGDKSTYEDDTDWSPSLKLELAESRRMIGKVFVDSTNENITPNQIRQGSGAYEEGEEGVGGVEVILKENKENGKIYKTTTATKSAKYGLLKNENEENPEQSDLMIEEYKESNKDNYVCVEELEKGEYLLGDFIPGDYTVSYTWGDDEYTVQKYKGTVVNKEVWDTKQNIENKEWYKDEFKKEYPNIEWNSANNTEIRTSDAIDNYETREEIDEELKEFRFSTVTTKEKMTSTTPVLGVGVEYDNTTVASSGEKYEYKIFSIDFGIVERARQELTTTKNIRKLKISLADGRIIADATVNEDGTLSGEVSNVIYIKPPEGGTTSQGILKVEMDSELLQSAIVDAEYEITIKNNSELDYISEEFYHYGIVSGNVVEMEASEIIDYANRGWNYTPEENPDWEIKQVSELRDLVAEEVYRSSNSNIGNTTILWTKKLEGTNLKPTEDASVSITFGKMLTSTDDPAFYNETEIILIRKTGGGTITSTPGNYVPGTGKTEVDDDTAEDVVVIPATGANLNYVTPIIIGVVSFIILGVGIIIIKKKILGK